MPKETRDVMGTVNNKGKLAGVGGIVKRDGKPQNGGDVCKLGYGRDNGGTRTGLWLVFVMTAIHSF